MELKHDSAKQELTLVHEPNAAYAYIAQTLAAPNDDDHTATFGHLFDTGERNITRDAFGQPLGAFEQAAAQRQEATRVRLAVRRKRLLNAERGRLAVQLGAMLGKAMACVHRA
eukprot:7240342-Prymnesium_polylepis.1